MGGKFHWGQGYHHLRAATQRSVLPLTHTEAANVWRDKPVRGGYF